MSQSNSAIFRIFNEINKSGIPYCQFKSTSHLDISFEGKTDFDILVSQDRYNDFKDLLLTLSFKQRFSPKSQRIPGNSDFLFYDSETEQLHHFDVHTRLVFGSHALKEYEFGFVKWILEKSEMHEEFPIRVSQAEFEFLLLLFRIGVKTYFRSPKKLVKFFIFKKILPANIIEELEYLVQKIDQNKLDALIEDKFKGSSSLTLPFRSLKKIRGLSPFNLASFRKLALEYLDRFRREIPEGPDLSISTHPVRCLSRPGIALALIGPDGAGKSTLLAELDNWLSYKLAPASIYMGRLSQGLLFKTLTFFKRMFRRAKLHAFANQLNNYIMLLSARKKASQAEFASQLKELGHIILFDRYPLPEFRSMEEAMDGPRIKKPGRLQDAEIEIYSGIPSYPDLVIVLNINMETSLKRKPEHHHPIIRGQIQKKVAAVMAFCDGNLNPRVHVIDATRNYNIVKKEVKTLIWDHLGR